MENPSPEELADKADVVFCCLPHVASMEAVPKLLSVGLKVIDLSADYRLKDPVSTRPGTSTFTPTRPGWGRRCMACPSCSEIGFRGSR